MIQQQKLGIIIVMAAILVFAGYGGVEMLKYTEACEFCAECHSMQPYLLSTHAPSPWLDYTHSYHDVGCYKCHIGPGIRGIIEGKVIGAAKEVYAHVLQTYEEPLPRSPVQMQYCLKCHAAYIQESSDIYGFADPHIFHVGGGDCNACHKGHWSWHERMARGWYEDRERDLVNYWIEVRPEFCLGYK
ncbi:MAG: NapC/NirT family cytochrome c [Methanocellales archaeon]|nr:NapC/NirT family cytochrome c [Methanocellales archaeon]